MSKKSLNDEIEKLYKELYNAQADKDWIKASFIEVDIRRLEEREALQNVRDRKTS